MTTVRFQSEPAEVIEKSGSTSVQNDVSEQSLSAALQSIVLTLCLKDELSAYDYATLKRLFENDRSLMIVKNSQCLFPLDIKEDDFSLCLVLQDGDLNVCDLKGRHPHLAGEIENAWPSLLAAVNKVKQLFAESDSALLINRTSGRILAASHGFSAISGLTDEECTGQEYGELSRVLNSCFSGNKIHLQNLNTGELYLSIVSISNSVQSMHSGKTNEDSMALNNSHSYRLLDESHAVGLYASRFNALLESSLKNTFYPETLARLEQTISELMQYCRRNELCLRTGIDSPGINACLRFLVQSILMSHRNSAGESAITEIEFDYSQENAVQAVFTTPVSNSARPVNHKDEWWELADNLARRIGVEISDLQVANDMIINRIQLTLKHTQSIYAK